MARARSTTWGILAAALLALHALPVGAQTPAAPLNEAERKAAASLAEQALKGRLLWAPRDFYLIDVELLRDKEAETSRRALVTHFRYEGDLAILSVVDLDARQVVRVETRPHQAVGLAEEELRRAEQLALQDPRVAEALGDARAKVRVEALVIRTGDEKDPYFGHRVVRLLFKLGADYLASPVVNVDLTAGRVDLPAPVEAPPHS
jgi:hypothetical protein